jgi:hypothetical protein
MRSQVPKIGGLSSMITNGFIELGMKEKQELRKDLLDFCQKIKQILP